MHTDYTVIHANNLSTGESYIIMVFLCFQYRVPNIRLSYLPVLFLASIPAGMMAHADHAFSSWSNIVFPRFSHPAGAL